MLVDIHVKLFVSHAAVSQPPEKLVAQKAEGSLASHVLVANRADMALAYIAAGGNSVAAAAVAPPGASLSTSGSASLRGEPSGMPEGAPAQGPGDADAAATAKGATGGKKGEKGAVKGVGGRQGYGKGWDDDVPDESNGSTRP